MSKGFGYKVEMTEVTSVDKVKCFVVIIIIIIPYWLMSLPMGSLLGIDCMAVHLFLRTAVVI